MIRLIAIGAAAGALILAGCGGDDDDDGGDSAAPAAAATAPAETTATKPAAGGGAGTTVKTSDSQYGQVLFGGNDQAIYYFDKESGSKSECYGACAEAWPPVLTEGDPQAGSGVQAGLLGTTPRDDGTTQVTYDGHPLYYYVDDPKGEVLCHNVDEFGGLWLAVQGNGQAVS
jgi:predicted lipoprotein with Yx(FWY)xxD motif